MNDEIESNAILPGSNLGVFGGGQLGRMFAHAAQRMGYHVHVYAPEENGPAAQVADYHVHAGFDLTEHRSKVIAFAKQCAAVTLEFENVSSDLVSLASQYTLTRPASNLLQASQDRQLEKSTLSQAGFPTTPFASVQSVEDLVAAGDSFGWPIILKTARSGYDGKGQSVVDHPDQAEAAVRRLGGERAIAEQRIDFVAEVSILVARNANGECVTFPLIENRHENHILDLSVCPVSSPLAEYESVAREIGLGVAEQFRAVGLFCVEFFVTERGSLLINEIAPRPHNSGHLTIEAFSCSQFEQQVRAVSNLPLAAPELITPAAMVNLLGDVWQNGEPAWNEVLKQPHTYLHLYGKAEPRVGRKMGHITVLDQSGSQAAANRAGRARDLLASRQASVV